MPSGLGRQQSAEAPSGLGQAPPAPDGPGQPAPEGGEPSGFSGQQPPAEAPRRRKRPPLEPPQMGQLNRPLPGNDQGNGNQAGGS
jgi:hypothetical protein